MKRVLFLSLVTAALLTACNSKSSNYKAAHPDTVKTLALYRSGPGGLEAKVELVYRIDKDSLSWKINDDSTKADKSMQRVSQYYVPILDSAKKVIYIPYPAEYILIDGRKNVDSIFKAYKLHFPYVDTSKITATGKIK